MAVKTELKKTFDVWSKKRTKISPLFVAAPTLYLLYGDLPGFTGEGKPLVPLRALFQEPE